MCAAKYIVSALPPKMRRFSLPAPFLPDLSAAS